MLFYLLLGVSQIQQVAAHARLVRCGDRGTGSNVDSLSEEVRERRIDINGQPVTLETIGPLRGEFNGPTRNRFGPSNGEDVFNVPCKSFQQGFGLGVNRINAVLARPSNGRPLLDQLSDLEAALIEDRGLLAGATLVTAPGRTITCELAVSAPHVSATPSHCRVDFRTFDLNGRNGPTLNPGRLATAAVRSDCQTPRPGEAGPGVFFEFTVPQSLQVQRNVVMQWLWFSNLTDEIYSGCLNLSLVNTGAQPVQQQQVQQQVPQPVQQAPPVTVAPAVQSQMAILQTAQANVLEPRRGRRRRRFRRSTRGRRSSRRGRRR